MLLDRDGGGDVAIPIAIGSIASRNEEGVGAAVRQSLLREGWGDIELQPGPKIIPIGQGPGRGSAKVDHIRPDLSFQCQEIAAMPGWKIPTLVLTLIPV